MDLTPEPAELAGFYRLAQNMAVTHDVDALLLEMLDTVMGLTGAQRGILLWKDPVKRSLVVRAARQIDETVLKLPEMESCRWVIRTVLHAGEGFITSVAAPPALAGGVSSSSAAPEAYAILGAPLRYAGQVSGVLYLDKNAQPPFAGKDLELANAIAIQAALVLEVAQTRAALHSASETRAKFISTVTHELRIPMTSIKGYADLLRQGMSGALNEQQLNFVNVIRSNVERMSVLISDLSDVSRIETGRLKLGMAGVSLSASLEEARHSLQARLEEKEAQIESDLPAGLPALHADPQRLVQVLTILLSNALKYGPARGRITVTAQKEGNSLRVEVRDCGIGISAQDQARLFEAFFRSEDARVREQQGWGLGLHLALGLVALMGGEMGCTSVLDQGSTFWFTLPVEPQASV